MAETIIGLLVGDSQSFLSQDPAWMPALPAAGPVFGMGDLLKYALRL